MNPKPNTSDLKDAYRKRAENIRQQIIEINGKLILHQEAFNKDAENYAYIADLDRIEFLLGRINNFIKH